MPGCISRIINRVVDAAAQSTAWVDRDDHRAAIEEAANLVRTIRAGEAVDHDAHALLSLECRLRSAEAIYRAMLIERHASPLMPMSMPRMF